MRKQKSNVTLPSCPKCLPHLLHMRHSHSSPHARECIFFFGGFLFSTRQHTHVRAIFRTPFPPHISSNTCLRFFCSCFNPNPNPNPNPKPNLIVPEESGACAAGHFHRSELEWRGSCTRRLDVCDARAHTREGVDSPTLNLVHSGRSDFFRSRRTLRSAFLEPADQIFLKEQRR